MYDRVSEGLDTLSESLSEVLNFIETDEFSNSTLTLSGAAALAGALYLGSV